MIRDVKATISIRADEGSMVFDVGGPGPGENGLQGLGAYLCMKIQEYVENMHRVTGDLHRIKLLEEELDRLAPKAPEPTDEPAAVPAPATVVRRQRRRRGGE